MLVIGLSMFIVTKTCKVIFVIGKHWLWIIYEMQNYICELYIWDEITTYTTWKSWRYRTVNWQYSRGYNRMFFHLFYPSLIYSNIALKFCTTINGWADTNNGQFLETTYIAVVSGWCCLPHFQNSASLCIDPDYCPTSVSCSFYLKKFL